MNEKQILDRASRIREIVARAAERSGREPGDVALLPVTKGHPPAVLAAVVAAGFQAVGENRVGEAEVKLAGVGRLGLRWHMIGHLQRNKAGRAVRAFDVIESVDSVRLARRLQLEAERMDRASLPVLVQVNAAAEDQKSGLDPAAVVDVVGEIEGLDRITVRGLMAMAPLTDDERLLRRTFRVARECLERCRAQLPGLEADALSMGMSNDFEVAIEEGSTELRLGTALLGERREA